MDRSDVLMACRVGSALDSDIPFHRLQPHDSTKERCLFEVNPCKTRLPNETEALSTLLRSLPRVAVFWLKSAVQMDRTAHEGSWSTLAVKARYQYHPSLSQGLEKLATSRVLLGRRGSATCTLVGVCMFLARSLPTSRWWAASHTRLLI